MISDCCGAEIYDNGNTGEGRCKECRDFCGSDDTDIGADEYDTIRDDQP